VRMVGLRFWDGRLLRGGVFKWAWKAYGYWNGNGMDIMIGACMYYMGDEIYQLGLKQALKLAIELWNL